jgi:hypothetical protein
MPPNQVHSFMDRMMFGKSYWKLHQIIDKPYWIWGRKHRILFHDYYSTVAIAQKIYPNDSDAEWAAWMHVELDNMCSADPKLLKMLKKLAKRYYRVWWKSKKGKKPVKMKFPGDFLKFFVHLKKLLDNQKQFKSLYDKQSYVYTIELD